MNTVPRFLSQGRNHPVQHQQRLPTPDYKSPSPTWQDIDPPNTALEQSTNTPLSNTIFQKSDKQKPDTSTTKSEGNDTGSLPRYNDVSGVVTIDQEGLPQFLSPKEEQEGQTALENAVREKMLGLLRETEFTWARPCSGTSATLPPYSLVREKEA